MSLTGGIDDLVLAVAALRETAAGQPLAVDQALEQAQAFLLEARAHVPDAEPSPEQLELARADRDGDVDAQTRALRAIERKALARRRHVVAASDFRITLAEEPR